MTTEEQQTLFFIIQTGIGVNIIIWIYFVIKIGWKITKPGHISQNKIKLKNG